MSNLHERLRDASDDTLRRVLGGLPRRMPPPALGTRLRVLASKERSRRSLGGEFLYWCQRLYWEAGDMMRSLALPTAGGVFSAVVLLGLWVIPTYPVRAISSYDIPTALTANHWAGTATDVAVKAMGPVAAGGDAVVDVTIDDRGRIIEYQVVSGPIAQDPDFRRRLENLLLFTEFTPATAFGLPGVSKLRLTLSSSYVDVKG